MAQEEERRAPDPVELTRRLVAAFDRGDVDAIERFGADDAVLEATGLGIRFEGRKAISGFVADWLGSFEDLTFEVLEVDAVSVGIVLVLIDQSGRPAGTLATIQQLEAWVIEWVDGRITQLASYLDIGQARAAAEHLAAERG